MNRKDKTKIKKIVNEVLKRHINENYRDLGTTSNLTYYYEIFNLRDRMRRCLNRMDDEFEFLHSEDWIKFFNRLRSIPSSVLFYSKDNENAIPDVIDKLEDFVNKCQQIPYPNLSTASNSSFVDKANNIAKCLKYAYKLYDDFIDYLVSRHEENDLKAKDIDSDWLDFENDRQKFIDDTRERADTDALYRRALNPFSRNNKGTALKRYNAVINNDDDYNERLIKNANYPNID